MTNILIECIQKTASVQVGVLEALRPLEETGLCQVHYQDTVKITQADIKWCDVFICVRGCELPTLHLVQVAKKAGRFLIYFLDDDLLEIPDGNPSTNYFRDKKIKTYLSRTIELCDVLWAVNGEIVNKYKKFVKRTALLRVPAEILCKPPRAAGVLHVLYAGSIDHSKLIQEILVPVIKKLLKKYSGQVDFTFIGADPDLRHTKGVKYYPYFHDYEKYQKVVLSGGFSVGLAPIYDTPFYNCKYYNKFIEYSSCGIVGVYSDCKLYQQIIQPGTNGVLCKNNTESWCQAIEGFIKMPERAREMALHASELIQNKFSYTMVSESLKNQVPEIISFRAPLVLEKDIHIKSMAELFYQERVLFLCRTYGILSVFVIIFKIVKKVWKYIRKKLGAI